MNISFVSAFDMMKKKFEWKNNGQRNERKREGKKLKDNEDEVENNECFDFE